MAKFLFLSWPTLPLFLGSHLNDSLAGYRILCLKCFYPFIFLQYRNVLSFRVNFHFQKLLAIIIAKLYMCICILKRFLWGFFVYYSGMIQFHNSLPYNMSLSLSLSLSLFNSHLEGWTHDRFFESEDL